MLKANILKILWVKPSQNVILTAINPKSRRNKTLIIIRSKNKTKIRKIDSEKPLILSLLTY